MLARLRRGLEGRPVSEAPIGCVGGDRTIVGMLGGKQSFRPGGCGWPRDR